VPVTLKIVEDWTQTVIAETVLSSSWFLKFILAY
jgi:hypothetical protein